MLGVVVDPKFFCSQRSRVSVIVRNVSVDWSWRLFHRVIQHCCLPVLLGKKILTAVECRRLFAFSGNFPPVFICVMKSPSRWIDDENINNILNAIVSLRNIYLIPFDFINSIFSSRCGLHKDLHWAYVEWIRSSVHVHTWQNGFLTADEKRNERMSTKDRLTHSLSHS